MLALLVPCRGSLMVKALIYHPGDRWFYFLMIFEVYSNETVNKAIKDHLLNDIIWPDFSKLPDEKNPTIRFHIIEAEKLLTLGEYEVFPVRVNHFTDAFGFIVRHKGKSIVFTQDTGPTDRIWEVAKKEMNLVGIFCEVSFPNSLLQVAKDSLHHTAETISDEIKKMPGKVPIYLGHLKPNYEKVITQEIQALNEKRVTLLKKDGIVLEF